MSDLKEMYQGMPFSPDGYLTKAINSTDTDIHVNDEGLFPPAPNIATISNDENGEVIIYTAVAKGILSGCTRGIVGSAKDWAINTVIARNYTCEDQKRFINNILYLQEHKVDKIENKDLVNNEEINKLKSITTNAENKITNDITGNAATATKLKTPVNIFGLPFDGSKNLVEDDNHKLVTNAEKIIIREASNPNLLINGDFQVWQRGTEFIIPINIYTADRWKSISTNGSIAGNGIRKNVNGMEAMLCDQIVSYHMEEYDLNKIANKMVTLSWSINGQIFTNTFICPYANPVFHIGIGGGTILNWAKLELGEIASPFIPRPYAEELALCKRYYEKGFYVSQYTGNSVPANLPFFMPVRYTVEKRISPNFIPTSFAETVGKITGVLDVYGGTGDDIVMSIGGHTGVLQYKGVVTHNPVYQIYHFYWTTDAEIY